MASLPPWLVLPVHSSGGRKWSAASEASLLAGRRGRQGCLGPVPAAQGASFGKRGTCRALEAESSRPAPLSSLRLSASRGSLGYK